MFDVLMEPRIIIAVVRFLFGLYCCTLKLFVAILMSQVRHR